MSETNNDNHDQPSGDGEPDAPDAYIHPIGFQVSADGRTEMQADVFMPGVADAEAAVEELNDRYGEGTVRLPTPADIALGAARKRSSASFGKWNSSWNPQGGTDDQSMN